METYLNTWLVGFAVEINGVEMMVYHMVSAETPELDLLFLCAPAGAAGMLPVVSIPRPAGHGTGGVSAPGGRCRYYAPATRLLMNALQAAFAA